MDDEIVSMTKFGVYRRLPRSAAGNRQILGCRWVCKRKVNKHGVQLLHPRSRLYQGINGASPLNILRLIWSSQDHVINSCQPVIITRVSWYLMDCSFSVLDLVLSRKCVPLRPTSNLVLLAVAFIRSAVDYSTNSKCQVCRES